MAHYDIFRHLLAMKFPAYGHALWEPNPGNLYPAVEVGDVGYIHQGKFRRLFNVLLPANHPSHCNFGVPEYHEQLTLNIENHIEIGKLSPHNFCSAGVTSGPQSDRWADGPREEGEVSFSCPMKEGAVLCLPIQAKGKDTVASADFGKWIIKHIDRWFVWARQLGLEINRMEDIILVTGTHRTRSWTNVAFPGGQEDAQASFRAKVDHRGGIVALNWQFSSERNRGVVLNHGPDGTDLPEDQCIFIRGFRVTRKLKILPPRLKGAAGPNPDSEGYDEEPDAELMPIPAVPEYRDPLHTLLEYIAEEAPPNCDMLLVHDDDLARLDRIYDSTSLEGLQSDEVLSHVQSLKPTVHSTRIDLSSTRNNASAETGSVWVATLSNIFEKRSSSSTSSTPRSPRVRTPLRQERSRWYANHPPPPCPPSPASLPEPNVPGSEGGHLGYMPDHTMMYINEPCPSPLHLSPVPPTYAVGRPQERSRVPRPVSFQLEGNLRFSRYDEKCPPSPHPSPVPLAYRKVLRPAAPQLGMRRASRRTRTTEAFTPDLPDTSRLDLRTKQYERISGLTLKFRGMSSSDLQMDVPGSEGPLPKFLSDYSSEQPGYPQLEAPLIPAHRFPVPRTYTFGDHANAIPRVLGSEPVAHQLGMGHINRPDRLLPRINLPYWRSPTPPLLPLTPLPDDIHQARRQLPYNVFQHHRQLPYDVHQSHRQLPYDVHQALLHHARAATRPHSPRTGQNKALVVGRQ
ncbi:hypothetical protein BJY52DRAFT_536657 [Lactarius psammicola]|nr:hypothetical protein BJY52DRAFT_536657 [Lactarius psammicola]